MVKKEKLSSELRGRGPWYSELGEWGCQNFLRSPQPFFQMEQPSGGKDL